MRKAALLAAPRHEPYCGRSLAPLALLLIAACSNADGKAVAPVAAAVQVAPVEVRDVPVELRAFGVVEAKTSVSVLPQVTGRITQVLFKEGDFVKKGDLLFTIDTRPYAASLAAAQAELERTRALSSQAALEKDRYVKMRGEGVASEQEVLQADAVAASSAAAVASAKAGIESARINVALTKVLAPIDGKTGGLLVHAGSVVQANAAQPLVVIRSLAPIQVRFAVPERHTREIREAMSQGPLPVRVTARSGSARAADGQLTFLENEVDAATGTLSLKAEFANTDLSLWPGAAVDATLTLGVDRKALVVPESAISAGQKGNFAFVVNATKHAELRNVDLAYRSGPWAVVRAGVAAGESVVTDGQVRLRPGALVTVQPPTSAPSAASGAPAEPTRSVR